jgi:hypothetical protein
MVQPAGINAADVHRRPPPHRLEPFEDLDIAAGVSGFWKRCGCHVFECYP